MKKSDHFSFVISLSVLNHLGRNLYRSFVTVLGEAISNSWDADARNVWIFVNRDSNSFVIKDDGTGMTADDFQNKFLKIGYSKRRAGHTTSKKGRPFIGRKGIGKLALLSCADRISVLSKTRNGGYVGGTIENSGLDKAITDDLTPQEYPLGPIVQSKFAKYIKDHEHGTVIYFDGIKGGIKNSLATLKKIIALYFRFSLVDRSFNIFIDGEKISYKDLEPLANKTDFVWTINDLIDPYVRLKLKTVKESKKLNVAGTFRGFIASVNKPRDLTIMNLEERVTVDLFVNGRLREKNILRHHPTARIVEDYLYGQIHFDELDDGSVDRFTSDREGVVADDSKYQLFLTRLRDKVLRVIIDDWDKWRLKHRQDGDPENKRISKRARKSEELFNAVADDYIQPEGTKNKAKIDKWVDGLSTDATYNFSSYAECFIAENLVRKYIGDKNIKLSKEANEEIAKWKAKETTNKNTGNVSVAIRKSSSDTSYLSMDGLANLVDKAKFPLKEAALSRDAHEYKPIRDALAHTALLTDAAKMRLTVVFQNIKARINTLLTK